MLKCLYHAEYCGCECYVIVNGQKIITCDGFVDDEEEIFVWSIDKQCWISDPPSGYNITTPPSKKDLKLIKTELPASVLNEYIEYYIKVKDE